MKNIVESESDGKTVDSDEPDVSKYFRVFNPVFISLVLVLFTILIFRDAFLLPYIELVLRLVIPTMYECNNLGAGLGFFAGCISYFLALLVLIFYSVALNCESLKQYVVGSILGVISTGGWFFWGAILFVVCGIRAH
tara:strand:+ start:516 stop:926 length:411 start_codon:yes stop_codon:yes gene_type:complete